MRLPERSVAERHSPVTRAAVHPASDRLDRRSPDGTVFLRGRPCVVRWPWPATLGGGAQRAGVTDVSTRLAGVPVPTLRGDDQLREVGAAVADFAEAVRDFRVPSPAVWRNPQGWPLHGDTVIHNDIAPWNMLECDQRLSGLVDEVARAQVTRAARVAAGALGSDAATARHWDGGRFTVNSARSLLWLDRHRGDLEQALT